MSKLNKIYDESPVWLQNIMTSTYGLKLYKHRYGKGYYKYKDFLAKCDKLSRNELIKLQNIEIRNLIIYAFQNSPFYKEFYKNINLEKIKSADNLKMLPILTKELLRKNVDKICTIPKKHAIEGHTGGTTGKPLIVYFTKKDSQRRMAMLDYFKEKNGFINIKMKRASFSGKHIIPPNSINKIFWRDNLSIKQRIYSSFHITEENLPYYVKNLNKYKPIAIDGFFSSIYEIANYIKRNNILMLFHPKAIFPTSETVTEREKIIIEDVFNCPVRNQYASSEGAPFLTECRCGSLHYELLSGVFEHFEMGSNEVLVTSFTTYGTPLIRYQIEDNILFKKNDVQCKCGAKTPLVEKISGRKVDFLYATNGAKIYLGNIANIFKNIPNSIIRSQIVQNEMDDLIVKIIIDKNFVKKHESIITDEIKHKFGKDMNIKIDIVKKIPRATSGKYRLIINNLDKERRS